MKEKECYDSPWCFPGVKSQGMVSKLKQVRVGSDVWMHKNVLITNGPDIGNGLIAATGAVITKNVPGYAAVCVGGRRPALQNIDLYSNRLVH